MKTAEKIDPAEHIGLAFAVAREAPRLRDPAVCIEDRRAEAMIAVVRASNGFDPSMGYPFSTYAGRCAKNGLKNQARSSQRRARMITDADLTASERAQVSAAAAHDHDEPRTQVDPIQSVMLKQMVSRLEGPHHEATSLYAAGNSHAAISKAMQISVSHVTWLLRDSIQKMKAMIADISGAN